MRLQALGTMVYTLCMICSGVRSHTLSENTMKHNNNVSSGSIIEDIVHTLEDCVDHTSCTALNSNMDDSICVAEASVMHKKFKEFTLTTNSLQCTAMYIKDGHHKYKAGLTMLSPNDASHDCVNDGGHLVYLETEEEYQMILTLIKQYWPFSYFDGIIVGGKRLGNGWYWYNGVPIHSAITPRSTSHHSQCIHLKGPYWKMDSIQ